MKLGLCQMPVTASQQENHAAMRRYVRDAAAARLQSGRAAGDVVLPI